MIAVAHDAATLERLRARRGPARIAAIPPEVLDALNDGLVPTVSLTEFLALDVARLARSVALQIGLDAQDEALNDALAMLPSFKPLRRHGIVARALYQLAETQASRDAVAHSLATHPSDIARSWAAQWVQCAAMPLAAKLEAVRRFAADPHFGVREVAWMAVRDEVAQDVDEAVRLLAPWVLDADANVRRFASELTRPRGVWCAHLEPLKAEPWRAGALLEPLRADDSRYVQNSVANWLNDAARTQPDWVQALCRRWEAESVLPATRYIVRRARRSFPDT
ncbi:MAG TPA: DNA alkylation repair protein [Ramlibacter sp.]|nr:DNA alkylation repair protein [Ramlibacter sp.]